MKPIHSIHYSIAYSPWRGTLITTTLLYEEEFIKTIIDIKGECTFNIPDVSTFTKEQKIAFDQMIDFLADMIEKYGDKIPKGEAEAIKQPNKKTA